MLSVLLSVSLLTAPVVAQEGPIGPFPKEEYAARREKLMDKIGGGYAVILGAFDTENVAFRQGHDFLYLTGVSIPGAFLIVDGASRESTLFFTITEKAADGAGISLDLVRRPVEVTGIERARPAEQFTETLAELGRSSRPLYTCFQPEEIGPEVSNEKFAVLQKTMTKNEWDGRLTRELQFVENLRKRFPGIDVRDCSPLLQGLRKYKSPAEIDHMRRAAQIGVRAHRALIESTEPEVSERSLAAVFEFVCKEAGAQDLAYYTILMSGKNHAYGHYHQYTRTLKQGDFVILDAGPSLDGYSVDISTTFPASGKFTARQAELYQVALAVHGVCIANYRPGITLRQVGAKVDEYLKSHGLGAYAKDFAYTVGWGGYNHPIGMAVHDVMGAMRGPDEVLQPGFVFACDIQLFRLEEEIGIRIEDTVAITKDGCEVLSKGLPRTIAEIEALMKGKGMLQVLKGSGS